MSRARHFKAGGAVPSGPMPELLAGNKDVIAEAKAKKAGGSVGASAGGGSLGAGGFKKGGKIVDMGGSKMKRNMNRPGRKMGGRVGADKSPLSSAHRGVGGG